jgi:hypothetical protein
LTIVVAVLSTFIATAFARGAGFAGFGLRTFITFTLALTGTLTTSVAIASTASLTVAAFTTFAAFAAATGFTFFFLGRFCCRGGSGLATQKIFQPAKKTTRGRSCVGRF